MRYYRIELTDQDGTPVELYSFSSVPFPALAPTVRSGIPGTESGVITSMLPDGMTNPAALNIEIDIEQKADHVGDQKSYVRIYGLDLRDIYRRDLNPSLDFTKYTNIRLEVGMQKGLPLANPRQAGLVMQGIVMQAFGNWVGTDMTLDMIIGFGRGSAQAPPAIGNTPTEPFPFSWPKGSKLSDAISKTVSDNPAFAGVAQELSGIADDRTADEDRHGYYLTTTEFAQMIQRLTQGQRGVNDQGVMLHFSGQKVKAADTSNKGDEGNPIEIDFQDLIGQVTWFEMFKLTCKLVMRGDLELFGFVKFTSRVPVQTTPGSLVGFSPQRPQDMLGVADGATLRILQIHHWGNFRQPDAMAWNTTLALLVT